MIHAIRISIFTKFIFTMVFLALAPLAITSFILINNNYESQKSAIFEHYTYVAETHAENITAYSGKTLTWDEVYNSDMKLGPQKYEFGELPFPPVAIPGKYQFA